MKYKEHKMFWKAFLSKEEALGRVIYESAICTMAGAANNLNANEIAELKYICEQGTGKNFNMIIFDLAFGKNDMKAIGAFALNAGFNRLI
jgi:hypothetical protein